MLVTYPLWKHCIVHQRSRIFMQTVLYPMSVIVAAEMCASIMVLLSTLQVFEAGFLSGITQFCRHPLAIAGAVVLGLSILALLFLRYLFRRFIVLGSSVTAHMPGSQ